MERRVDIRITSLAENFGSRRKGIEQARIAVCLTHWKQSINESREKRRGSDADTLHRIRKQLTQTFHDTRCRPHFDTGTNRLQRGPHLLEHTHDWMLAADGAQVEETHSGRKEMKRVARTDCKRRDTAARLMRHELLQLLDNLLKMMNERMAKASGHLHGILGRLYR